MAYLDGLIRTACDQSSPRNIKRRAEYTRLRLQRTRLRDIIQILERCARVPVPERQCAVVAAREEDTLRVDGEGVDDRVVPAEVEDERPLWTLPLLDIVASC